jgi:2-methylcitrate dehydratase PrpD
VKSTRHWSLTRRALLKAAAGVAATAARPGVAHAFQSPAAARPVGATAPSGGRAVIDTLTTYMAAAATRDLPADAAEKAKHHILDTLAAMISGAGLPPGRVALAFARARIGERTATVAASDLVCGPIEAALANGVLAHSDETDDSHAPSHSHPGCSIVPAALATGEQFGIDGQHLLRAVALGYDVGPRVTFTLGGLPFQMQTHHSAHSIAGDFGACAAAACTAKLNAQQMRWVIDYAAQQASGIAAWQRDTEHIEKALVFGGFPARNGVSAALLIHAGGTGVEDVLSGADNFLMTFAPNADPALLVDALGERFEVSRTNIKKWTVGSPIQAPLDAIENLRKRRAFDADEVQGVVVRVATSEAKTVNNREMPDICLQHMLAVMLLDRTASFAAAHDKGRMRDAAVLRQRAKVVLQPDEDLEKLYPRREAIVEVTLRDGTKLSDRVGTVRGTFENPMTRDEVAAKARDLMMPVIGPSNAARLVDTVLALEDVKDIRTLRPLLQAH